MSIKVILEVVSGPLGGKVFVFESHDTFIFGRKRDCHAQLPKDNWISRHHFLLEVNPPHARLRDLGSQNGTFVNRVKYGGRAAGQTPQDVAGRSFPEVDLKHGDQITVGQTTIDVRVEMPLACRQCGATITSENASRVDSATDDVVCSHCRERFHDRSRPVTVREVVCERCGCDVSAEAGGQFVESYVCRRCQTKSLDEVGGLRHLIQMAVKKSTTRESLVIEGYDLGDELGRGGMGVVYRAVRKCDGAHAAVKVLLAKIAANASRRQEFLREIDITRSLRHPNIVQFFESGEVGGAFYLTMELCREGSLDKLVQLRGGSIPEKLAVPIVLQCLDGLEYAHQRKFVHRDIKPQNILLDKQADKWTAKISDFGLAKSFASAGLSGMTATGVFGGTFQFMPREQITEFKYPRPVSDLWSLAATLYFLLSGCYPLDYSHQRDPVEVLLNDDPKPLRMRSPGVSHRLAAVVDRALAMETSQRYQTAVELKQALKSAVG